MGKTVAETISSITKDHLKSNNGLLFGQCVTAVGWIGGTVPQLSESDGIVELPISDVSNPGIAVGAALVGRRPIYVIRYQGFLSYNASPLINYASKTKDLWNQSCPILIRAIAMEGSMGVTATGYHHGPIMRTPGIGVIVPITPNEWKQAWEWFMSHDQPLFVSEHRNSFAIDYEMDDITDDKAKITIMAVGICRVNALKANQELKKQGINSDLFNLLWVKPFEPSDQLIKSLNKTNIGLIIDGDYDIGGPSRSLAYDLMQQSSAKISTLALDDRSAGYSPQTDNTSPSVEKIIEKAKALLKRKGK